MTTAKLFRSAATALALFAGLGLATQVYAREHNKVEKIEKIEKVEKAQKVEKIEKPEKPEKPEKHSNR